jgi:hypothetical protein
VWVGKEGENGEYELLLCVKSREEETGRASETYLLGRLVEKKQLPEQ